MPPGGTRPRDRRASAIPRRSHRPVGCGSRPWFVSCFASWTIGLGSPMMLSRQRQNMNTPVLTLPERNNIESGSWFSKLSLPLRNAILSRSVVRKLPDGALLSSRGQPAEEWIGVAKGAVRVSSVSLSGKQITLTYVEPGVWFGDIALFDGMPRTHDANAHGPTTLLVVRKPDFKELLSQQLELYEALLRLNCRRLRLLFDTVEDLN